VKFRGPGTDPIPIQAAQTRSNIRSKGAAAKPANLLKRRAHEPGTVGLSRCLRPTTTQTATTFAAPSSARFGLALPQNIARFSASNLRCWRPPSNGGRTPDGARQGTNYRRTGGV
jgi:hypothetical protein